MEYLISFLEGIITFISPCLLPMLPIYIVYFAGGDQQNSTGKTLRNAAGFVCGFTIIFVILGAFAATVGALLREHQAVVNIITGIVVILFGLNFMGILRIGFLNNTHKIQKEVKPLGFFSTMLFGMIFSIGWTPCIGTFLGSALMLASSQGSVGKGIGMLFVYSLGLGIPFMISALLIDKLKGTFQFIKQHYTVINFICGLLLVVVGILMITGFMNRLLGMLS